MKGTVDQSILSRAGRLADKHAMFWIRELRAPVADVWPVVSTREGLARWWIVPPAVFDLRIGGDFKHHWRNKVTDFRTHDYIDFAENTGAYAGTGGMRFELAPYGDHATLFMFLDTWGPDMVPTEGPASDQPGGPGTPWAGVAAGWHAMMDTLEKLFNESTRNASFDALCGFYRGYLDDLYRWRSMVQPTDRVDSRVPASRR